MNEAPVKLTVAPDAQEPVTVSPVIDTEMRPPRSAVNEVEPPPIDALASSQIFLKFEPVDGGTPVIAAGPNERGAASDPGAAGVARLTIGISTTGLGLVAVGATAVLGA